MTITPRNFQVTHTDIFKQKMLNWANRFSIFCMLDNNGYNYSNPEFDCVLAAGTVRMVHISGEEAFQKLKTFYEKSPSWLFGHVGYTVTSEAVKKSGKDEKTDEFEPGFFFEPEILLQLTKGDLSIIAPDDKAQEIFDEINAGVANEPPYPQMHINVIPDTGKSEYLDIIAALKDHIRRGDCYELNFCQRFSAENVTIDPLHTYQQLVNASPMPFAALYKLNNNYCICASPERYLKKSGMKIISQPMKGTSRRNSVDSKADEASKKYLRESSKEKSENVMVVDLVRNDLSKICIEGSVAVDELFGVYSFPHVHQMTSTVSGTMQGHLHWTDALSATFPMGSMTGAPKKRVMELIARYEKMERGLFSGSIGYITPSADFDFNVVIRSIFYNKHDRKLSFFAGSGITFYSDPENEYEECKLKTDAITSILSS